jgi:hypothetical protein
MYKATTEDASVVKGESTSEGRAGIGYFIMDSRAMDIILLNEMCVSHQDGFFFELPKCDSGAHGRRT